MTEEVRSPAASSPTDSGPFLAKVVSHLDPTYMGALEVELLHEVGNQDSREGQLRTVKYLSPFYGVTGFDYVGEDPDDHDNTQKAYGMWFVPPDVGTIVVCIFIGGDVRKGYWMGCVLEEGMNFSLPGYAATEFVVDDTRKTNTDKTRVPVSEYNKVAHEPSTDTTSIAKPENHISVSLEAQGLLQDDIRGITSSSARREVPSMVFGISTPGPIDKNGKKDSFGKHESKVAAGFVSRLGGSSFVMDDGDDKWERKTKPTDGPPEYVNVEDGETGERDRPHNELIRIRTRTGHQILLHNSEDLIYIGNSRGTAWIELCSDGKIDIYAEDSVSIRTKQDFNFYADRDINLEAGRNFNTKVGAEMHTHVGADQILIVDQNQTVHIKQNQSIIVDADQKIQVKGSADQTIGADYKQTITSNLDIKAGGHIFNTSGGSNETNAGGNIVETAPAIHMNGPGAASASAATVPVAPEPLQTHILPDLAVQDDTSPTEIESILRRIPTPEPYPQHENLDPTKFKPENTDRDTDGRNGTSSTTSMNFNGSGYKTYTTAKDTFKKEPPTEE